MSGAGESAARHSSTEKLINSTGRPLLTSKRIVTAGVPQAQEHTGAVAETDFVPVKTAVAPGKMMKLDDGEHQAWCIEDNSPDAILPLVFEILTVQTPETQFVGLTMTQFPGNAFDTARMVMTIAVVKTTNPLRMGSSLILPTVILLVINVFVTGVSVKRE